jgi:hypothetical protein
MTIKQQGGIFGRNPAFNEVDVTGTVTANGLTVNKGSDGSDIVSMTGASAARFLKIQSFTNSGAAGAGYDFNATSGLGAIQLSTANTPRLKVGSNGDISVYGDIIMSNGAGIDFSATSGTGTSELFDDYEEGTWTPVISDGTNNATSDVLVGTYTKTGDHVHVQGRIRLSSLGSVSGSIRLTGLPFNSKAVSNNFGAMTIGRATALNITAGQVVVGDLRANVDYVQLNLWDSALGNTALQSTEFSADGDISFSMNYLSS